MNKKLIGYLIAALLIGTLVVIMVKTNLDKPEPIATSKLGVETGLGQGEAPPDFELTTLSGDVVKLSDFKGKKVILNFWASYCPPCKAEMPHMQNYYEGYKEEDNFEILAVNLTPSERNGIQGVEDFIDTYELTFPIPLDEEGIVGETYQILTIPTTYMIGTDGVIGQQINGPMDESMLKELVENLD
ncbi:redoxin domain-containing protein [Sporosarcina limicola]|uniref:Peroxiredoxin n=1 Tax=Sporosarcina limicola TaxID=34101 RepID=A0A927MI43_9BACL|nr:redoxin domain-containing protein [Sporosarcina limicola]MBE1555038.1 peroxiredoxin [Sporosarcina limicola]